MLLECMPEVDEGMSSQEIEEANNVSKDDRAEEKRVELASETDSVVQGKSEVGFVQSSEEVRKFVLRQDRPIFRFFSASQVQLMFCSQCRLHCRY